MGANAAKAACSRRPAHNEPVACQNDDGSNYRCEKPDGFIFAIRPNRAADGASEEGAFGMPFQGIFPLVRFNLEMTVGPAVPAATRVNWEAVEDGTNAV